MKEKFKVIYIFLYEKNVKQKMKKIMLKNDFLLFFVNFCKLEMNISLGGIKI